MRHSGRIVRQVLDHVRALVAPGVTTMDLERAAEKKIKELGAKPAFKGYYDYPCVLCTSVNGDLPMDDVTDQIFRILEDHHA